MIAMGSLDIVFPFAMAELVVEAKSDILHDVLIRCLHLSVNLPL